MEVKPGYKQTEVGVIPEDWVVKQLGEIATFLSGKSYESHITEMGDYFLITLDSLDINGKLKDDHKKVSYVDNPLSKDDIVMILSDVAHGNFLGLTDLIPENSRYILNQRVGALKNPKGVIPKFLSSFINFHQDYFRTSGQGSSQQNLSKNDILKFRVLVAPLPEQRAIAAALSDVDTLLAALEALIAKKRLIKQGTMQDLLTPPNAAGQAGQRRLPGFSGEWGTKTLGQLGNFSKGKGLPKNDLCTDGDIPAIPYTAIYTEFSEIIEYECINDFTVSNESIFISEPHILIAGSSNMLENVGKATAYNDYREVAIGGDIILFKTEADVRFISYLLNTQTHRKKIILLSQGSTIRHVYSSTFVNYEIGIPLLKEQQAIAEILSDMDAEINALEQRRAKTRLLKQGMMQELLTGRTRLVDN